MENKSEGNKNKNVLQDTNLTMHKMDSDGGNTIQRLYTLGSNHSL